MDANAVEFFLRFFIFISLEFPLYFIGSILIYRNRNILYIKKRRPILIFFSITSTFFIQIPSMIELYITYKNTNNKYNTVLFIIDNNAWILRLCVCLTISLRVWLLYYDLKLNIDLNNLEWLQEISDYPKPFYIKFKHKFGSLKWWFKWCMIILFINALLSNVLYYYGMDMVYLIIFSMQSLSVFVCCFGVWFKMLHIRDGFNIKEEIKQIALVFAGLLILFVIFAIVSVFNWNANNLMIIDISRIVTGKFCGYISVYIKVYYIILVHICLLLVDRILFLGLLYVQTLKPIKDCYYMLRLVRPKNSLKPIIKRSVSETELQISDTDSIPRKWFKYIATSKSNFDKFMNHLVSEFCVEVMLYGYIHYNIIYCQMICLEYYI